MKRITSHQSERIKAKSIMTMLVIFSLTLSVGYLILVYSTSSFEIFNRIIVFSIILICVYKGRKEDDIFNPYYIFLLTPLSLLIYVHSVSSTYLLELNQNTWNIAIINMVMFIAGLSFTKSFRLKGNYNSLTTYNELKKHSTIFLIIGLLPIFYGVAIGFSTLLSGNLYDMKPYVSMMPLSSVFSLFKYPAMVGAIKSKKKSLIILFLSVFIIVTLLNFNKTDIGFLFITFLISLNKYSKKNGKVNIKIYILIGFFIITMLWAFSYYDFIRSDFNTTNYFIQSGKINWNFKSVYMLPYMYLVTPWTNLQHVMETQSYYTYGLWSLKPFLGYLQLDNIFANSYELSSYSSFNTFTFIAVQFKDFGILGSGIISYFLGMMIKKTYSLYKKSDSPLHVAIYALHAMAVAEMFFSNHFFMQSYPFTIIIIMWIYPKVFRMKTYQS